MIMVILMGIGSLSIMQNNNGRGLNSGVTILESCINEARTLAMAKGVDARLLINNDPNDTANYRRQIVTVYNDDTDGWTKAYRAVSLPSGVYVDDQLSVTTLSDIGTIESGSGDIEFTRDVSPPYLYIKFNKLGICKQDGASNPGASLALVSGRLVSSEVQMQGNQKVAVVVWRNGGTTRVNDPEKIN